MASVDEPELVPRIKYAFTSSDDTSMSRRTIVDQPHVNPAILQVNPYHVDLEAEARAERRQRASSYEMIFGMERSFFSQYQPAGGRNGAGAGAGFFGEGRKNKNVDGGNNLMPTSVIIAPKAFKVCVF